MVQEEESEKPLPVPRPRRVSVHSLSSINHSLAAEIWLIEDDSLGVEMTSGYDGSVLNGLQAVQPWEDCK